MSIDSRSRWAAAACWLAVSTLSAHDVPTDHIPDGAKKVVRDTMTHAGSVAEQARALTRLAWPAEPGDPHVREFARLEIVHFGEHGMPQLREAMLRVKPEHQADLTAALIQAYSHVTAGIPADYLPALDLAIWYGTREARELAIPEIARFRFTGAVLPIMDAAVEDPELLPVAIGALGQIGDDRARFFLESLMLEQQPPVRDLAALALGRVGGRAALALKSAMRSDDAEIRGVAARALLPVASVDDLSVLHEFVYTFPDDDPATLQAVRERAAALEKLILGEYVEDSTTPQPD